MATLNSFQNKLNYGQVGESLIAKWLQGRGWSVLPVYQIEINTGKGPRLFAPKTQLIAPDILALKANNICWIEAKHKTAFSWHRNTGKWVTGIDLKHYEDYCKIAKNYPHPVWLLFLHEGGAAKDSPSNSPSGLFGNDLNKLMDMENHRSPNWAHGMVYWALESLIKLEDLKNIKR